MSTANPMTAIKYRRSSMDRHKKNPIPRYPATRTAQNLRTTCPRSKKALLGIAICFSRSIFLLVPVALRLTVLCSLIKASPLLYTEGVSGGGSSRVACSVSQATGCQRRKVCSAPRGGDFAALPNWLSPWFSPMSAASAAKLCARSRACRYARGACAIRNRSTRNSSARRAGLHSLTTFPWTKAAVVRCAGWGSLGSTQCIRMGRTKARCVS